MQELFIWFAIGALVYMLGYIAHEATHYLVHRKRGDQFQGLVFKIKGIGSKFQINNTSPNYAIVLGPLMEIPVYLLAVIIIFLTTKTFIPGLFLLLALNLFFNLVPFGGNDGSQFIKLLNR